MGSIRRSPLIPTDAAGSPVASWHGGADTGVRCHHHEHPPPAGTAAGGDQG